MSAGAVVSGSCGGTPIVLIHGLGQTHRVWDLVAPKVEPRSRIVAVDISARDAIEQEADDVASLIEAPAIVVGLSRGGLIATSLAERHPDLVERLVLLCTPWSTDSRQAARNLGERALGAPGLGPILWRAAAGEPTRRRLTTAFAPGAPIPDQFVRDLRSRGRRDFLRSSRAIDAYLGKASLPARLRQLEIPAHIVVGELDRRVSPMLPQDLQRPHRLLVLDGVGHTPPWEAPDLTADLIAGRDLQSVLEA